MSDFILTDGDIASFLPIFGAALVAVQPGTLTGNGKETVAGKPVCVDGDEKNVSVECSYIAPPYTIPGVGTLKIDTLANDQKASKTNSEGQPVLLKGNVFTAKFEIKTPAQKPPVALEPPVPDPSPSYAGQGMFQTTNAKVLGN